jgi:hypothetical protein
MRHTARTGYLLAENWGYGWGQIRRKRMSVLIELVMSRFISGFCGEPVVGLDPTTDGSQMSKCLFRRVRTKPRIRGCWVLCARLVTHVRARSEGLR